MYSCVVFFCLVFVFVLHFLISGRRRGEEGVPQFSIVCLFLVFVSFSCFALLFLKNLFLLLCFLLFAFCFFFVCFSLFFFCCLLFAIANFCFCIRSQS